MQFLEPPDKTLAQFVDGRIHTQEISCGHHRVRFQCAMQDHAAERRLLVVDPGGHRRKWSRRRCHFGLEHQQAFIMGPARVFPSMIHQQPNQRRAAINRFSKRKCQLLHGGICSRCRLQHAQLVLPSQVGHIDALLCEDIADAPVHGAVTEDDAVIMAPEPRRKELTAPFEFLGGFPEVRDVVADAYPFINYAQRNCVAATITSHAQDHCRDFEIDIVRSLVSRKFVATVFPSLGNQFISSKQGGTIYERNASNCTATLLEFCVRHRTEPVCLTEVDLPSNEFHSSSQSGTLLRYFFPQYAASGAQKSSVHRESSHQRILTSYKE